MAVAGQAKHEHLKTVLSGAGRLSSRAGTATSHQPPTGRSFVSKPPDRCYNCNFHTVGRNAFTAWPICHHPEFTWPYESPHTIITPFGYAPIGCPLKKQPDHDGQIYIDAKGWKIIYNGLKLVWLWLTQWKREGHWYFDA